jgi:hypothetical protein
MWMSMVIPEKMVWTAFRRQGFTLLFALLLIGGASTGYGSVTNSTVSERKGSSVSGSSFEAVEILDTAHFTEATRRTHQLLNPPKNLHPWLKWLLYSSRLDKKMVLNYYATLKKRDQIYKRAIKSSGQLGIVYQGKVFRDIPPFVTPDWADGDYSLAKLREEPSKGVSSPRPKPAVLSAQDKVTL